MPSVPITSRQHPLVQRCRRVAAGKGTPGEILLDGEHLIRDAVRSGVSVSVALVDDRQQGLGTWLASQGIAVSSVSDSVMAAASPVRSPAGVVAIAHWQPAPVARVLGVVDGAPAIALVDVQDPGNVGTVIRSADAFGAAGVLVLGTSASPTSWRVLRAAMGSTFRIPVATGDTTSVLNAARQARIRVVATTPTGGDPPTATTLMPPVLILVGGEGAGLPRDVAAAADERVTLPMRAGVESLNAATAASILLWEAARLSSLVDPG